MNNDLTNPFKNQTNKQTQGTGMWNILTDVAKILETPPNENITISWGTLDESEEYGMLHQDFEMSQIDIDYKYRPNFDIPEYVPENVIFLKNNGIPVGILSTMTYESNEKPICYICSFYISPFYRRKGFGKQILTFLINHCKSNNYSEIKLGVLEKNKNAKSLYEQFGFKTSKTNMILQLS